MMQTVTVRAMLCYNYVVRKIHACAMKIFYHYEAPCSLLMKGWEQGVYVVMLNRTVDRLGMMDHAM